MAVRKRKPQYFLGGAYWNNEDQYPDFIESGRWETGSDKKTRDCLPCLEQMRKGDRIAIKKMLGQGSSQIQIRAIGIIKLVDTHRGIVYVDWIRKGMKRKVDSSNAFSTLHGPYLNTGKHADWINQIFCLWCRISKKVLNFQYLFYFLLFFKINKRPRRNFRLGLFRHVYDTLPRYAVFYRIFI